MIQTPPVNSYLQPIIRVYINDELVQVFAVKLIIPVSYSMQDDSTGGISNTLTFTMMNGTGLIATENLINKYKKLDKVEMYLDYLDSGEFIKNKEIVKQNGASRTMKKVFTGYIYNRQFSSSSGDGNKIMFICKNNIFRYKKLTSYSKQFYGKNDNQGSAWKRFFDTNNIDYKILQGESIVAEKGQENTQIVLDITDSADVRLSINIGNNVSVYDAIEQIRQKIAHYIYIDSEDKINVVKFEKLFGTENENYYLFEYGKNLISNTVPDENDTINCVVVYYKRTITDNSIPAIIYDAQNIINTGQINPEIYMARDINDYNGAYKFGINKLKEKISKAGIITISTFLFPYIQIGESFKVINETTNTNSFYICTKITHDVDSSKTTIEGINSVLDFVSNSLIENRIKTYLGVQRG
jgi:hypothetical protein